MKPEHHFFLAGLLFVLWVPTTLGQSDKTTEWIATLQSGEASLEAKAKACRQLGESGNEKAIPALAALLDDRILSAYARAALERIPDKAGLQALSNALDTVSPARIPGILDSLGALGATASTDKIIPLVKLEDPITARSAMLTLGKLATREAMATLDQALQSASGQRQQDAAAALLLGADQHLQAGASGKARSIYDTLLKTKLPITFHVAATRGGMHARRGEDRAGFFLRNWRSKEAALRNAVLLALREAPTPAMADLLNAELRKTTNPDQEIQLLSALEDCHNEASIDLLTSRLGEEEEGIRIASLKTLSSAGGAKAARSLVDHLKNHPSDRDLTQRQLARMEEPAVDEEILKRLKASPIPPTFCRSLIELSSDRNLRRATPLLLEKAGHDP
ncbi:MAG: HEAT repeat domain-containing protein, partial [Verrucomicrobiota bacterium]